MVLAARAAVAKRAAVVAAIVAAAQTVVPAAAARGKRLLVLPAEELRGRQLHISTAELAGCCRLVRESPVVSAIPASVTCGSSKRDGLRPAALWPVRQESRVLGWRVKTLRPTIQRDSRA